MKYFALLQAVKPEEGTQHLVIVPRDSTADMESLWKHRSNPGAVTSPLQTVNEALDMTLEVIKLTRRTWSGVKRFLIEIEE